MKNKIVMLILLCFGNGYLSSSVLSEEISMPGQEEPKEFSISEEKLEKIQNEMQWLMSEPEVTIATKHETKLNRAPSIVTVITAEEIKNLGYRTLVEILRIVPCSSTGAGARC